MMAMTLHRLRMGPINGRGLTKYETGALTRDSTSSRIT